MIGRAGVVAVLVVLALVLMFAVAGCGSATGEGVTPEEERYLTCVEAGGDFTHDGFDGSYSCSFDRP